MNHAIIIAIVSGILLILLGLGLALYFILAKDDDEDGGDNGGGGGPPTPKTKPSPPRSISMVYHRPLNR